MAEAKAKTALLIIDMLNTLDFPGGIQLLRQSRLPASRIANLKKRCARKKIPILYVNDNFGHWHSDWHQVYDTCVSADSLGAPLARLLKPEDDDYFVLKPKHSGFFSSTLHVLLLSLNVRRLIITGIAGNICVLFTAHDAYMRDYDVVVPKDCVASNTARENHFALEQLRRVCGIKTPLSASLRL